jgi:hypothetical protein
LKEIEKDLNQSKESSVDNKTLNQIRNLLKIEEEKLSKISTQDKNILKKGKMKSQISPLKNPSLTNTKSLTLQILSLAFQQ